MKRNKNRICHEIFVVYGIRLYIRVLLFIIINGIVKLEKPLSYLNIHIPDYVYNMLNQNKSKRGENYERLGFRSRAVHKHALDRLGAKKRNVLLALLTLGIRDWSLVCIGLFFVLFRLRSIVCTCTRS